MCKKKIDYSLYICTDSTAMTAPTIEESVIQVLDGGATVIQLRAKGMENQDLLRLAERVKQITDSCGVPLIINDNVDIAEKISAAGVHLGQEDMPCRAAREILGEKKIIGVTAPTVELAVKAELDGADYIGVGAMFPSGAKPQAKANSMENLAAIRAAVSIPIVVIGGISRQNILQFAGMGINGAAMISDILADKDPRSAAAEMKKLIEKVIE